jgi:hypothetical protein
MLYAISVLKQFTRCLGIFFTKKRYYAVFQGSHVRIEKLRNILIHVC